MKKIASTAELQTELRRLMAYADGDLPSRDKIAAELHSLSERLAGTKQAGERDLIGNFSILLDKIDEQSKKAEYTASRKVLKVVADLLTNFGLTLDMNNSRIVRYREGTYNTYSGMFEIEGDLPAEGVANALWDVTQGLKFQVKPIGAGRWYARFDHN